MTILTIFGGIVFAIFCIIIGYKLAILRWSPKLMLEKLEKFDEINKDMAEGIKRLDDANKSNTQFFLSQIHSLGYYMKEKHNDSYVFDNMKNMKGFEHLIEPKEYTVDGLLDKASESGWDSLTDEEKNFLKDQNNE